jgi:hypothetical protein
LARNVNGWGRIHVVERLAQTQNPAIKDWLLREGFRNSVLYSYLAGTCARAGDLRAALSKHQVDRELLTAAGEIIRTLIFGGPAGGIDDYEDARTVIESYLGHIMSASETVEAFLHVDSIKQYLDQDESVWEGRYGTAWSVECRTNLRALCDSFLGRPEWADRVQASLGSDDEVEFAHADQAARSLGIETWDIHWRRLQAKTADPARWYPVMTLCDEDRIDKVIEFAVAKLDLARIATGAADESGFGPGFEQHRCLNFILQELARFPGRGAALIDAGLKSPVVRNRSMAVAALAACPRADLSSELENSLAQSAASEPSESLRERMQKILNGEPPSS